jgi:DNA invertase Pin-like site-specific DNA recombinase
MLQGNQRKNEKRVILVLIGYARVSTGLQNLDLQMDALTQHGGSKIFYDKMSGTKKQRSGLEEELQYARKGDTIVVWRLDRLGRINGIPFKQMFD